MTERRRFSRIIYQVSARVEQGNLTLQATIQDLSLHGLLIKAENAKHLDSSLPVDITFSFLQFEQMIHLTAQVITMTYNEIRLKIISIDIESISQLKRFIELNVGNNELLNRELEYLSDLGEQ
ncbi:PilZ domain-containing protein [Vibrio alfacsensis]|uniref:PilZ domain-containing protein n=1 Tax=Vibrio alfacsensis TaxID=1074311 RepID=UPI0040678DA2